MLLYLFILISCSSKKTIVQKKLAPISESKSNEHVPPLVQKTDIPKPKMPQGLPLWEEIDAPSTVYKPVAGLALSHDYTQCFKEWFQADSLPPTIRKFQGRILNKDEKTIGRMIQCPEERKKILLDSLLNNP